MMCVCQSVGLCTARGAGAACDGKDRDRVNVPTRTGNPPTRQPTPWPRPQAARPPPCTSCHAHASMPYPPDTRSCSPPTPSLPLLLSHVEPRAGCALPALPPLRARPPRRARPHTAPRRCACDPNLSRARTRRRPPRRRRPPPPTAAAATPPPRAARGAPQRASHSSRSSESPRRSGLVPAALS